MPVATNNDYTLLVLAGQSPSPSSGVPLYSARGLDEKLTPIQAAGNLRRSINGTLIDLSYEQFQKYTLTISCTDQRAPAMDGVWPGMIVTVVPATHLFSYNTGGSADRSVHSGSSFTEGSFTFYRAELTMMVTGKNVQANEYTGDVTWSVDFEEL